MTSVELLSPFSVLGNQPVLVGTTLAEVHARHASQMPTVVVLNGEPVMRAEWHRTVKEGDELALMVIPGKGGFKQILSVVALLVIAVVAPQIGLAIAGTSGLTANLIAAGVVLAGSLLVNALLSPSAKKEASGELDTTGSPTYNIQSQGNQARLLQPIPRLYGRHILTPDYAAKPYTYYDNNDAYLCQLFCLGVGKYDLEEVRIDKTAVLKNGILTDSYRQIEIIKYEPNQYVGGLIAEVETSAEVSAQEVTAISNRPTSVSFEGNRLTYTGNAIPADEIKADNISYLGNFETGSTIFIDSSNGNDGQYIVTNVDNKTGLWIEVNRTFPFQGTGSNVGIAAPGLLGPYVANPANTLIEKIELDIVWPESIWSVAYADNKAQYSYYTESVEVRYRTIDSLGLPTSDWTTRDGNTDSFLKFKYNDFSSRRETFSFYVPPGRYEVTFRRLNVNRHYPSYHNRLQWSGLKGYYVASNRYRDVTLLGVKIKADNQITSQTSRQFKTIQTAMLPVYGANGFSDPVPTRRISDAFIDACTNKVYGLGRSIKSVDYEALASLESTWTARGDTFDGVFDTKYTSYDALAAILYVGRAKPLIIGGVITAVRDEPRTLSRMVFTPLAGGIKKNSLNIEHVMNDVNSPTDAIVSFMDERTWTRNEVECFVDDADRDNPVRITGFGIVKKSQAWREGIYQVASNKYRRVFATFNTEMEGKMLIPMDKIVINHDMPKYGQSGELYRIDGLRWYSSERFILPTGVAYAGIRMKNGKLWGPVQVNRIINNFDLIEHYLIDYIKLGLVDSDGQFLFDSDGAQLTEIGPDYVYLTDSDGVYLTELGPEYKYNDKSILEIDAADFARVEAAQGPLIDQVNQSFDDTGDPGAIVFGGSADYVKPFRVIGCSPQSHDDVVVVCCNEDDRVHTAENDYVMPAD